MTDGPWRVASTLHLVFDGSEPAADAWPAVTTLASRLDGPGVPISGLSLVGPGAGDGDPQGGQPSRFPAASTPDLGAALSTALESSADCLVMDPAVSIDPEDLLELRRVADSDPMIAGVSPRFCADGPARGQARISAEVARTLLPAASYVPLPDRRCLYLKNSVLAQFRPEARDGAVDWDEYALSINRYGLRMAVANHSAARQSSGDPVPEPAPMMVRGGRLERSYPGARSAVASYATGTPQAAERLLAGLAPNEAGKLEVAFDLTHLGPAHSGTAELTRALIGRAVLEWRQRWDVSVVSTSATYDFHFADAPSRPKRVDPEDAKGFAAFVRIGQPFSWKDIDHAVRRAPAILFFMLDTIGLDCIRLAPDELDAIWRFVLAEVDGLLFNSGFTQRQFERRFAIRPDMPKIASLHSLRLEDYADAAPAGIEGDGVLILGNSFPHKYAGEAARMLARADFARPIVVLGPAPGSIEGVTSYASGTLDRETMSGLYRQARLVVYPSMYEGFGFPLLEALAHRRPVLVRGLAPFDEIRDGLPESANIHVFESDADLVRLVANPPPWTDLRTGAAARGWDDCVADLLQVLEEALSGVSYERVVRRLDFMRGRMEWIRRKPFRDAELAGAAGSPDDIERLAGLAGRTGQDLVLRLGRWPGAAALLRVAVRLGAGAVPR